MPRSRAELQLGALRGEKPRLVPPHDLGGLEREIFISVVNSVPAEHFVAEDSDLLRAYVCSLAQQRRAAEEIAGGSKDSFHITMHAAAVRSIHALASKLRLGPQARNRSSNLRRPATTRAEVSAYDQFPDLVSGFGERTGLRTFADLRRLQEKRK